MHVFHHAQVPQADENEAARNKWIDTLERAHEALESLEDCDDDNEDPEIPDLIDGGASYHDSDSDGDDSIPSLPRQWEAPDSNS